MYVELGEGHKEEESVCVCVWSRARARAVGGGGGEECLVCADDINSKSGEGST